MCFLLHSLQDQVPKPNNILITALLTIQLHCWFCAVIFVWLVGFVCFLFFLFLMTAPSIPINMKAKPSHSLGF